MAQYTTQTITGTGVNSAPAVIRPTKVEVSATQTAEYVIYFLFGLLEVLLVFRLVLKLMGASLVSGFVSFIYGATSIFVFPFEGIFRRGFNQGLETTSVIEPSTIVALIVYSILAWGVVKLVQISSKEQPRD